MLYKIMMIIIIIIMTMIDYDEADDDYDDDDDIGLISKSNHIPKTPLAWKKLPKKVHFAHIGNEIKICSQNKCHHHLSNVCENSFRMFHSNWVNSDYHSFVLGSLLDSAREIQTAKRNKRSATRRVDLETCFSQLYPNGNKLCCFRYQLL